MTNEQTATLLRQIVSNLERIASNMESVIADGEREFIRVWIGEGDEPDGLLFDALTLNWRNYDLQPKGRFTASQLLIDYAESLKEDIEILISEEK